MTNYEETKLLKPIFDDLTQLYDHYAAVAAENRGSRFGLNQEDLLEPVNTVTVPQRITMTFTTTKAAAKRKVLVELERVNPHLKEFGYLTHSKDVDKKVTFTVYFVLNPVTAKKVKEGANEIITDNLIKTLQYRIDRSESYVKQAEALTASQLIHNDWSTRRVLTESFRHQCFSRAQDLCVRFGWSTAREILIREYTRTAGEIKRVGGVQLTWYQMQFDAQDQTLQILGSNIPHEKNVEHWNSPTRKLISSLRDR